MNHAPIQGQESEREPERDIFIGSPSQTINFPTFVITGVIVLVAGISPAIWKVFLSDIIAKNYFVNSLFTIAIIAILYSIWNFLKVHCHQYRITTERLIESYGVLNRVSDELELYRVKDIAFSQPLHLRLFKLGNIILDTSDKSTPIVVLIAIPDGRSISDLIRKRVDIMRSIKGVREFD